MSDADATMIIPRKSRIVPHVNDDYFCVGGDYAARYKFANALSKEPNTKAIAYLIKNEVVLERCEYRKNVAICYRKTSTEKKRSIRTRFDITQVIYARMVDDTKVVDYLVITGYENFVFVEVQSGKQFEIQAVSFRVQRVLPADRGILIERYRVKGEIVNEDEDEKIHVFSLMHPNAEIMPVLYQGLGADYTNYAFPDSGMTLLPAPTENRHNLFLAYDTEKERHLILTLKKASKTEQSEAYRLNSQHNSRMSSAASSFRTTPRNTTTNTAGSADTPLRRSLRNRMRMMTGTPGAPGTEASPLNLNSRHSSFVSSTRTLAMSIRSQKSAVTSFRDTLCNFNLDGEILEEPEAEWTLVVLYQEAAMPPIPAAATGIATSTPIATRLEASTSKKANISGTPKGILLTPIAAANARREGGTPKRNVSFTSTPKTHVYSRMSPAPGEPSSSNLPHKRPNLQHTPIAKLGFSESDRMEIDDDNEVEVDMTKFKGLPNAVALAAVNELIKRQRKKVMDSFKTYDFTKSYPEKKADPAKPSESAPESSKKKPEDITYSQLLRARCNVLRYYNRNVQWGLRRRFKPVNALYALLIYRRELQRAVIAEIKVNAATYLKQRVATRFFVTTDIFGHVNAAFLPGGSNKLKLVRWHPEQKPLSVSHQGIDAFDAIPIYGSRMFAVLRPSLESVHLYTGTHDLNALYMKGISFADSKVLQFVEGKEHTINLKLQTVKSDKTEVKSYEVGPHWSESIKKFFDSVSSTLPAHKAVAFFSKWYEISFKTYPKRTRFNDKLLTEYPVLFNYFFECLGLKVDFKSTKFIFEERKTPEELPEEKRGRLDSDEADNLDETTGEVVFNVEFIPPKVDLGAHAFAVFHIFHMMYESLSFYSAGQKYEKLFIEPLFVFVKLTNLEKYVEYYTSREPRFQNARIAMPEDGPPLPRVADAKSFDHKEDVVKYVDFIHSLLKDKAPTSIPRCPHWPQAALLCAGIAVGKVNTMTVFRATVGTAWQKRFNLLAAESAKVEKAMASRDDETEKCFKVMRALRMSICDIIELNSKLSEVFKKVVELANIRIFRDHEVSRRSLKEFPTAADVVRMQRLEWPSDLRAVNAQQMLNSSRLTLMTINSKDNGPLPPDQVELFLHTCFWKQTTKAFGRGAMDLKTVVPTKMGFKDMPRFELGGRSPGTNANHEFKINPNNPAHTAIVKNYDWGYYYHGIAHTLSFASVPDIPNVTLKSLQSWLLETQEKEETIAGAILGFGLSNLFHNFNYNDVHDMATLKPESALPGSTVMAIAASNRGTCDMTFFRVISTFLPFYTEPTNIGLKISPFSQVSALVSLGLLFEGTCNQSMTNLLIDEMAKETVFGFGDEGTVSRYSYILCAGVAVGLINLGQGVNLRNAEAPTTLKLGIDERLELLLTGGPRMSITSFGRANKNMCPVQAVDLASINNPNGTKLVSTGSMYDFTVLQKLDSLNDSTSVSHTDTSRMMANVATGHLAKESCTVRETPKVNVHVTSPAACLALTLKYLRTNDQYIMDVLRCPDEMALMETIPPQTIMLRVMSVLLIQWNDIPCSVEAIDAYMPKIVQDKMKSLVTNEEERRKLKKEKKKAGFVDENYDVDLSTIAETWIYYQAGCCLALGIRYASTLDPQVYQTLEKIYLELFCGIKYRGITMILRHQTLLTCSGFVLIAISLVMAGSGHLDTMRLIRRMRNYTIESALFQLAPWDYQIHAMCNTALGFLFLGNGRHGIGGRIEDSAMLLISVYPIVSKGPADNLYYFQPMRFFYSLATEERHLVPVDSNTHTEVVMMADIRYVNGHFNTIQLPCVIPPLNQMRTLTLRGRDYEEVVINLQTPKACANLEKIFKEYHGRIPVKKAVKSFVALFDVVPKFTPKNMQDLNKPRIRIPPPIETTRL
uniref:Anaphase-promoting complex subunit 1 n=1 Tax=Panagrellus redivivus TaxID=6233 RepID=A0A7E4W5X7_PANRE